VNVLGRYLLREIVAPFVAGIALLFLMLFAMAFLQRVDVLLGSTVGVQDVARFTLYLAPQVLQQSMPIALLLGILLGVGRLSDDGEVTALHSLGVGPAQIIRGPLALAGLIGAVMLTFSFTVEPWGERAKIGLFNEVIKRNLSGDVKPGVFYDELSDLTLYAEEVDPQTHQWRRVLLHDDRDKTSPLLVLAKEGGVNPAGEGQALRLLLGDGHVHRANAAGTDYSLVEFERGDLVIGMGEAFFQKNRGSRWDRQFTPVELLEMGREAEERGENQLPYLMSFHRALGQAVSPVALALLGAPLAMSRRGRGKARGFVLTLATIVLYYALSRACENLGASGRLPVLLAGQLPNVVFLGLGLWSLRRMSRVGALG
jgi:lipopolysaccharide export system permease protein